MLSSKEVEVIKNEYKYYSGRRIAKIIGRSPHAVQTYINKFKREELEIAEGLEMAKQEKEKEWSRIVKLMSKECTWVLFRENGLEKELIYKNGILTNSLCSVIDLSEFRRVEKELIKQNIII